MDIASVRSARPWRLAAFATTVILALCPTAVAQEAQEVERKFMAAYEAKDWPRAIELGRKLVELDPRGGANLYNLACVYALSGDKAAALEWLEKAIGAGFSDDGLMGGDPDFESIREDPAFQKMVQRTREAAEKKFEGFKKRAEKAVVEIVVPEGLDATKPAPAIVALHGFGGNAKELAGVWKAVAGELKAIVIAPQGVNSAANGWEWGDLRGAEYLVMQALEKAGQQHKIDEKRTVISGFSQGGLMAYSIALKSPKRFRGVIPVAAGYNTNLTPKAGAGKEGYPRFFIMVGSKDQALPANRRAAKDFEAAGISHKLNVYDGVGHTFPNDREGELRKALQYVLE